ncbi:hypothetical protein [Actinacidiphila rubida]|uniref:Uncharacterized protein n=1 Tax=Actinacidiphila rubida TaxID=310780 RepID=A0A1H8PLS5_9ACTN|nr:hypothetical protein [Actinacidiphila rubida]SEO42687.1 hypothetical protein SAMN05216267_102630 [Actinacidiphila rubida]
MNNNPLSTLAHYLTPSHNPAYLAALRIAEAAVSGRRAAALADWLVFGNNPARVVSAIADQVMMPADSARVDVYEALGALRGLLDP